MQCQDTHKSQYMDVKQPGKFTDFPKKERQNLPAVFSILLFLIYLLTYLTGKADAESITVLHGSNDLAALVSFNCIAPRGMAGRPQSTLRRNY